MASGMIEWLIAVVYKVGRYKRKLNKEREAGIGVQQTNKRGGSLVW